MSAMTAPELIKGSPLSQTMAIGPILRTIISSNTKPKVVVPMGYGKIKTLSVTSVLYNSCVLSATLTRLLNCTKGKVKAAEMLKGWFVITASPSIIPPLRPRPLSLVVLYPLRGDFNARIQISISGITIKTSFCRISGKSSW